MKNSTSLKDKLPVLLLSLFCAVILLLSIRGLPGNPDAQQLDSAAWKQNGPFELSPERGRFALTYSLTQDKSVAFSTPLARFAAPDLGYANGKYVSLFAPLLSHLVIPGFVIGSWFSISQVGAFVIVALFAILNVVLIYAVGRKIGASTLPALLAGLVFIFATPAFTYAVTLYQHHVSTFLLLLSIYILLRPQSWRSFALIWFICGVSAVLDYPNFFMMLPVAICTLGKILHIKPENGKINIGIRLSQAASMLAIIFPLAFLFWFNAASYGNPFTLSGSVTTVKAVDGLGRPAQPAVADLQDVAEFAGTNSHDNSVLSVFKTRNLLNGFYIHFISPDRGILYFAPIILLGIFGLVSMYQKRLPALVLFISIIGINVLLYSMWGDPWGGWAFGSRYLIPSYALLSIAIGYTLSQTKIKNNLLLLSAFTIIFLYSAYINTAGALTTSANPPKVEILSLERQSGMEQKYTYERNFDYLNAGHSKSFIFQTYITPHVSAVTYFTLLFCAIGICASMLMGLLYVQSRRKLHGE